MVLNLGAYLSYLRELFNISVWIHMHSYCKGCGRACRGSWKHARCQALQVILIYSHRGIAGRKE